MLPTLLGKSGASLIGFEGVVEESEAKSKLLFKARFGQPFLSIFYIGNVILFPVLYIFDIQGARENLDFFDNFFLNVIIPPSVIWMMVMIYYQIKIMNGKDFVHRALTEYKKTQYNIN